MNNPEKIQHFDKQKRCLVYFNVATLTLIVGITVMGYFGSASYTTLYFIWQYSTIALLMFFEIAWGVTLIKLYREVKNSQKLLPNEALRSSRRLAFLVSAHLRLDYRGCADHLLKRPDH